MFDKLFIQDERVLLHRWDLLHAQFMLLARSGQMVLRGAWEAVRLRDVLAHAADELLAVERDLARFGDSPAEALPPAAADLWRVAAEWVTTLREWAVPPETWTADEIASATARRQFLEAQLLEAITAYPFGDAELGPAVAEPVIARGA